MIYCHTDFIGHVMICLTAPSMPQELSGSYTGFTSVSLSWRVPEMTHMGILGYRVTYAPTSGGQLTEFGVLVSDLSDATTPSVSVGGLDMFTEYTFTVSMGYHHKIMYEPRMDCVVFP